MKKYLLICLLGFGTILPTNKLISSSTIQSRIITVTIEGWVFLANSEGATGLISQIQIYDLNTGALVRTQNCDGYSCSVSLTGLPAGNYLGYVIAQNGVATKKFGLK